MPTDANLTLPILENGITASIRTIYGSDNQHYQVVVPGFTASGNIVPVGNESGTALPVNFPSDSLVMTQVNKLGDAVIGTRVQVSIDPDQELTFTGELSSIVGITTTNANRQVIVEGATAGLPVRITGVAGATAIGITGTVGISGASFSGSNLNVRLPVGQTLDVVTVTSVLEVVDISGSVTIQGTEGEVTPVIVGGTVGINHNVNIQNPTGATLPVRSIPSTAFQTGFTTPGAGPVGFDPGFTCRSGVRLLALSVGATTDFIFVGHVGAVTTGMYPLRAGEDVFIDIDNLNKIAVAASAPGSANLRYIAS